jgi:hypothetical protein
MLYSLATTTLVDDASSIPKVPRGEQTRLHKSEAAQLLGEIIGEYLTLDADKTNFRLAA